MKKRYLLSFILFVISPIIVCAATPKVLTVETKVSGYKISYTGTADDGVTAVMCKVFGANDKEIDKLSSAVDNNKFDGSFTVTDSGDYKVSCAKYEGGEIVTSKVTVANSSGDNVKTFDAGIVGSLILLGVSGIGIAMVFITKRSKKASK